LEALQTKGLLIAKTLCVTNAEGLPLRMINVTDQPQTIYKNTFAAMAETIPDRNIINKFPLSTLKAGMVTFWLREILNKLGT
jgi:hypothetical protein